uniref:Tudor domain-containing protein n=1 Tax=viral metagenome TaxID=1070528 RepID=A0A6C0BFD4_9ZZZZ
MSVSPLQFVTANTRICAYFINEEESAWYHGTVTKVHKVEGAEYVECDIVYDDGDLWLNTRLYEHDFENECSEDAWRFVDNYQTYMIFRDIRNIKEYLMKPQKKNTSFLVNTIMTCVITACIGYAYNLWGDL